MGPCLVRFLVLQDPGRQRGLRGGDDGLHGHLLRRHGRWPGRRDGGRRHQGVCALNGNPLAQSWLRVGFYFPRLGLNGIHHYWKYICYYFSRGLKQMEAVDSALCSVFWGRVTLSTQPKNTGCLFSPMATGHLSEQVG